MPKRIRFTPQQRALIEADATEITGEQSVVVIDGQPIPGTLDCTVRMRLDGASCLSRKFRALFFASHVFPLTIRKGRQTVASRWAVVVYDESSPAATHSKIAATIVMRNVGRVKMTTRTQETLTCR